MAEPLVVIPGDVDKERGYRVRSWRDHVNYECIYCQFSTLWLKKMEEHQGVGDHPWAYPGQYPAEEPEWDLNSDPEY